MKKALPILLFVLSSITYAQEFSLLDQGNIWAQRYNNPDCDPDDPYNPGCTQTVVEIYRINGETTYEGLTYANVEFASNGDWYPFIFLREEEGVIYRSFGPQGGPDGDVVLYNFNLEVGDMIGIDSDDYCDLNELDDNDNGYADVIDVSTQFIAGENRKVITFDIQDNFSNFSGYQQWIEGIGSTSDFYFHFIFSCVSGTQLNCFGNNEEIFSFSQFESECDILLETPEFSMTDQGNKWAIKVYDELCDGNHEDPDDPIECDPTSVYIVEIDGETIINNTTYSNLGDKFIRQEDGIVYQYSENAGETILYDFTLEIGDTIPIDSNSACFVDENNNNLADVINVSTQFIAGYDRKVITFDLQYGSNLSDNIQWIEGIGSANDPTDPNFFFCDVVLVLECFNNGEEIFSFSQSGEECEALLTVPETPRATVLLTPNPIVDQSTVTINTFQPNTTIIFYNLLGQQIHKREFVSNTTIINRSEFPSNGIYIYQIQQQGQIIETQKFIVK